ncbi:7 transmembrane receptor [Ancylostoma ceylanicum]|uniref:Thyrotropin-releasing hormone receptor n=1 Tax=Ancylostoma ceylanicum TaxID=53326 RepID=A0A0D6LRI9_9BILA|nr:7 transmembrane receptor [Ancylostoma ceylanicum]
MRLAMQKFHSEELRSLCPGYEFDTTSEWIFLPELPPGCAVPPEQAEWLKYCMAFIFVSLSVIGIVGNILVITVVLKVRGMKTPTNCYLVSLAVSDTLFFIATTPTELSSQFTTDYPFGSICCSLFTYLPYLAINSSALSITAFTIERFIGICHPFWARTICTVKRAKLIICIIWTFSLIYNFPWLFLSGVIVDEEGRYCDFKMGREDWKYKVMYVGDLVGFYVIPMFLNIVIYAKIAIVLSQCGDKMKQDIKEKNGQSNTLLPAPPLSDMKECHVTGRRNSSKGRNQVVKMLALVVFVFATCWLPYRAMVVNNSFRDQKWDSEGYIYFSKTMIFINCAINPILYNLMSARSNNDPLNVRPSDSIRQETDSVEKQRV